ncbi:DUF4843 domain-containing protein [Algoriphagus limi]|uniref:DUF4843 domain-containing protein n=1 Tax=Algoriphagus limi TaxID=2975273 RepID=A0ABT2G4R2_9BACT|nr:DUF4843 domain-containing protein [Algoriphagus limi]MCS5490248.1 DUF4843 domain-containing protein [Algoriphagus limi]
MKKIYSYLAVVFAMLAITSCFDDPGRDAFFQGNEVEFQDGNLPNGFTVTQVRRTADQVDVVDIQVNRVSTDASREITVSIGVDPASTAVQGVHVDFTGASVTIPAGQFVATFPVNVLTGNIDPSESPVLKLVMEAATGAEVSDNYGDLDVNINVICESNISTASDTWTATSQSRFGTFTAEVTVVPVDGAVGEYVVSDISAGLYAAFGFSTTQQAIYGDNCNVLTFLRPGQRQFNISAPSVEPFEGSFDPATNTLVLYWSDPNNGINGTTTLVKN